jgi:hypothetical protein
MKHILLLLTLSSLFSGCQKFIDRYSNHWGLPPSVKPCKIDSIYPVEKGDGAFNTWTAVGIKYNQKGNPVLLNYSIFMYALVQFPVHYKYDDKDRLIEVVGSVSDPTFDYLYTAPLHIKYVYEGNSQWPIRDSVYTWYYDDLAEVEDLYYDEKGRINRVMHRLAKYPFPETYETKYEYDANGNKQILQAGDGSTPATIEYSDKPSLYSLHPVWQLVHKDFSKNAVKGNVETYNDRGLPVVADLETLHKYTDQAFHNPIFLNVTTGHQYSFSHIDYACAGLAK